MTSSTARDRTPRWAPASAVAAGVLGLVANALLVGFFALTRPDVDDPRWGWVGLASDLVVGGFFAALLPVVVLVGRRLPGQRVVAAAAVVAEVALAGLAALQLALVAGLIAFESQVRLVLCLLLPVYGWLVVVSSIGHRTQTLPRSVSRFGLLLGVSWPSAMALSLAGAALGGSFWSPDLELPAAALLIPGLVLGSLNWLLLPVWPLTLARTSFASPRPVAVRSRSASTELPSVPERSGGAQAHQPDRWTTTRSSFSRRLAGGRRRWSDCPTADSAAASRP